MTATNSTATAGNLFTKWGLFPGKPVSIAPLVTFRITFGLLMLASILRFWWSGWITSIYILPKFHFTYMGFDWVQPLDPMGMHLVFFLLGLSAFFVALGFIYRLAILIFFIGFTYVELLDVTAYLNHYYFISLVAFIMIWLPANRSYSLDTLMYPDKRRQFVPEWTINILRFQVAVVYIFAGLAKLNPDWLLDAQPMRIWLPSKTHLPIIGSLMYETWIAYLFSWFGAVYDLFIVFFLLNRKTRPVAYCFVIIFHVATAVFFPAIGVFPYVMMVSSLIFFSGGFHEQLLSLLPLFRVQNNNKVTVSTYSYKNLKTILLCVFIYMVIQLAIPLRYLLYPGHLFWTEEGFRFSWRVMLMEKSGTAYFTVKSKNQQRASEVNNAEFLTPFQEKMMSTQPDMILEYAHYLAAQFMERGVESPEVYGEIYVTLNGARSRLFIDSTANLAAEQSSWGHYKWILPYK